jgi:hypothetical protein
MTVNATTGTIFVNPINHSVNDDYFIGLLKINHGGTNSSATPTAGAIAYGTGTAYAFTSAGTSGQTLLSNGASAPTWGTPAGSLTITDDNTSNTNYNLTFTTASSGTITGEYVNNGKVYYNPSAQLLAAPNMQVNVPTGGESYLYFKNTSTGVEKANINVYDNIYGNGYGYFEIYVTDGTVAQAANLNFNGYGAFGFDDNFGTAGQVLISKGVNGKTAWGNISGGTF